MTVTIFMVSLCAAMFVGMPVAFALLVCAVSLMVYLISIGTLDTFNTKGPATISGRAASNTISFSAEFVDRKTNRPTRATILSMVRRR